MFIFRLSFFAPNEDKPYDLGRRSKGQNQTDVGGDLQKKKKLGFSVDMEIWIYVQSWLFGFC